MTTQLIENTDIDLTVLINFEDEAICEVPECPHPASYVAWFNPCACEHMNICKEVHVKNIEDWNLAWQLGKDRKRCAICQTIVTHVDIRPI